MVRRGLAVQQGVAWPLPSRKGVLHHRCRAKDWIVASGDDVAVLLAPEDHLQVRHLDAKSLRLKSSNGTTTRLKFKDR